MPESTQLGQLAGRNSRSIKDMQDTGKWVVSAAAAVAAVLLAGISLKNLPPIGDFSTPISGAKVAGWVAALAVIIGIAAVGLVIQKAGKLFTVTYAALSELIDEVVRVDQEAADKRGSTPPPPDTPPAWQSHKALKPVVDAANTHLQPVATDISSVYLLRDELAKAARNLDSGEASATVDHRIWTSAEEVREYLDRVDAAIAGALIAADEQRVKAAYTSLLSWLWIAGGILVVAALVFVEVQTISQPLAVTKPTPVTIYSTGAVLDQLGPRCVTSNGVSAVAIGGTFERPEVAVSPNPTEGCKAARFLVPASGVVSVPGTMAQKRSNKSFSVVVPNVVGENEVQATSDLLGSGFTVELVPVIYPPRLSGEVAHQSPVAGSKVPADTVVTVDLSAAGNG